MGSLVFPPYEAHRDNTEEWQDFEKLLRRHTLMQAIILPVALVVFGLALGLWIVAFGGPS